MKTILTTALVLTSMMAFTQSKPLPYATGFDNTTDKAGWQEYRLGFKSNNKWGYNNSQNCSAPTALYHDYNVGGNSKDTVKDWFVSPALITKNSGKVKFKVIPTFFGTSFNVWIGTNTKDPANGNYFKLASFNIPSGKQCLDTFVNINAISDTTFIAFQYVGANYNAFGIDDIAVIPDSTTAITELGKLQLSLFPNPTSDQLMITIPAYPAADLQLQVFDLLGRSVLKKDMLANQNETSMQLDTRSLPMGTYLIHLYSKNRLLIAEKFIKTY